MKAIRIEEPKRITIVDLPMPVIEREDQVIIKIAAAGICGSDVSIYIWEPVLLSPIQG
ncbi:alcohol dehydrogenase catalytic domain-containing protein [uncultured Sphaerochaeta sp.]|uniref:alcohol dehydrogenase catalytic domain-containing protein n=1 Tax=uncultured Sphaerochaeta sp. TaxID=886478 RepID=UPI002A0A4F95|nr:alcohol dehydrogenase catalytic domain-containing protein [uncultured Sphaerochaeta sp.]